MVSLKSFIKSVRNAKTIADERAVIRKESANIRTSFRDSSLDQITRRVNISKLLFLYILGEKTHFGQVECLKLIASPNFADKRLGYLATTLLLDENQEVLTLLTNSLDNDMNHPNAFNMGLALCCLGNIASPELARDLYTNVERIISTANPYLRKKACLVAAKLVEKDPELAEIFLPKIPQLLNDKTNGPLLGALRLLQVIYEQDPATRQTLQIQLPKIIDHLKRVTTSGYSPEHDVMGIADPFLQVSLLQTLRVLVLDDSDGSINFDAVNDILTQVASNIESGKNSAHAVLYECVKTIFQINSDPALKVLGVNILGKFLSTKDNNTRYVALDSLLTVINIEPMAVQRHRATIVNCLSDGDISIRRRALELSFAILNEQNIRVLAREILVFLENSDNELKPYVTTQLTIAAEKYAPNQKWHFDTLIRMLKLAGNYITQDIISNILALIIQCSDPNLKKHIITKLFQLSIDGNNTPQFGLSLIACWCLGEYGEMILNDTIEVGKEETRQVTEDLMIDFINSLINNSTFSEQETVQLISYSLTTALKLSSKFHQTDSIEKLRLIINSKTNDVNLEIQLRANEYKEIFLQSLALKKGLLEKMPPPPVKQRESLSLSSSTNRGANNNTRGSSDGGKNGHSSTSATEDLLDLMNDEPTGNGNGNGAPVVNSVDLLSDIFGGGNSASQPSTQSNVNSSILDLFNTPSSQTTASNIPTLASAPIAQQQPAGVEAYSNSDIHIAFATKSIGGGSATIDTIVSNKSGTAVSNFQLLIAVPKTQKLQMSSATSSSIAPGQYSVHGLKINGKEGGKIKLRVKIGYELGGNSVNEMFDFGGFPSTL